MLPFSLHPLNSSANHFQAPRPFPGSPPIIGEGEEEETVRGERSHTSGSQGAFWLRCGFRTSLSPGTIWHSSPGSHPSAPAVDQNLTSPWSSLCTTSAR